MHDEQKSIHIFSKTASLLPKAATEAIWYCPSAGVKRAPTTEMQVWVRPLELIPILLLSPYPSDHTAISNILADTHWQVHHRFDCSLAFEMLEKGRIAVVICERDQIDGSWRDVVEPAKFLPNPPNVIVCSRVADESLWAEVLNLGGYDVLMKPFKREEVLHEIQAAWRSWKNYASFRQRQDSAARPFEYSTHRTGR